jgi:tetratricopeptide (TPR) repeat protein
MTRLLRQRPGLRHVATRRVVGPRAALALATIALALLAGCATPPAPSPRALTTETPEAMVAAIRAAAGRDDAELAVQPLRDPEVDDLREQALALEARHRYPEAAAALDKALALVPEDPALLQERAEAALLEHDPVSAERLARHAFAIGARVGPLCRRHWATIERTRLLAGDAAGAAQAQLVASTCKVTGPDRF